MLLFERYLYRRLALFFCISLFAIVLIWGLLDLSARSKLFASPSVNLASLVLYFTARLSTLTELLLSCAFALSMVTTIGLSMAKNEILALMTSGISAKRLLRPCLISSLFVCSLIYIHFQFTYPVLKSFERRFFETYLKAPSSSKIANKVYNLHLADGSILLYQHFDVRDAIFFDLIWIKSIDEIVRMEKLTLDPACGYVGEVFRRIDPDKAIRKVDSFATRAFPSLSLDKKIKREALIAESLSLTELFWQMNSQCESWRLSEFSSLFYYRLLTPLTPLLLFFALAPVTLHFSRTRIHFLLFVAALALLFVFFTITRSSLILAKREVVTASVIITLPFIIGFTASLKRYAHL